MKILATAYASPEHKGSGRHEPMVMTVDYGKAESFTRRWDTTTIQSNVLASSPFFSVAPNGLPPEK